MKIITTQDGSKTVYNEEYKETYHSHGGAHKEALELYLGQSDYLPRLRRPTTLRVLDVGLGLGYNACSTIEAWNNDGLCDLELYSLEKDKELLTVLSSGKGEWQKEWPAEWRDWCLKLCPNGQPKEVTNKLGKKLKWYIITEASELPKAQATSDQNNEFSYDFIWQDPFSPKVNTEMWSPEWFSYLAQQSNLETELLTYSVARVVKDALSSAGFAYKILKTTGVKKAWLKATLLGATDARNTENP